MGKENTQRLGKQKVEVERVEDDGTLKMGAPILTFRALIRPRKNRRKDPSLPLKTKPH